MTQQIYGTSTDAFKRGSIQPSFIHALRRYTPVLLAVTLSTLVFVVGCGAEFPSTASLTVTPVPSSREEPSNTKAEPVDQQQQAPAGSELSTTPIATVIANTSSEGSAQSLTPSVMRDDSALTSTPVGTGKPSKAASETVRPSPTPVGGEPLTRTPTASGTILTSSPRIENSDHPPFLGRKYQVGINRTLDIADVDGDGLADLITTNTFSSGSDIYALLNKGGRTFGEPIWNDIEDSFFSIAAADFNGDGLTDIAASHWDPNFVQVALSKGGGQFSVTERFAVGEHPNTIGVGDFDDDGNEDIIVPNFVSSDLSLLLGHGDGTFASERRISLTGHPTDLVVVDIDRNDTLDLIVSIKDATVIDGEVMWLGPDTSAVVLLGSGNGSFLESSRTRLPTFLQERMWLAHMDGDGQLDLVTLESGNLQVMMATPNGVFGPPKEVEFPTNLTYIHEFILNDRLTPELVVGAREVEKGDSEGTLTSIGFLRGDGRGGFSRFREMIAMNGYRSLTFGHLDGDGLPDLALGFQSGVVIYWGDESNGFKVNPSVDLGNVPDSLIVRDLDDDGLPDLAAVSGRLENKPSLSQGLFNVNLYKNDINVSFGIGGGDQLRKISMSLGVPDLDNPELQIGRLREIAAADMNRDGMLDIVVAGIGLASTSQYGVIGVILAKEAGIWDEPFFTAVGEGYRLSIDHISIGDLNTDGNLDVVVNTLETGGLIALMGNGDGSFKKARELDDWSSGKLHSLLDMNGDALLDLVLVDKWRTSGEIRLGNGDGSFRRGQVFEFDIGRRVVSPSELAVSDFNGDDTLDLGLAVGSSIVVIIGIGDGTFAMQKVTEPVGARVQGVRFDSSHVRGLVASDLNGDSLPDLVVANRGLNELSIYIGNGDGTFGHIGYFAAGGSPTEVLVEDVNVDGLKDLIVINDGADSVIIMLQQMP